MVLTWALATASDPNLTENNHLGGLSSYGQAVSTLGSHAGATPEEINAALSKNAQGGGDDPLKGGAISGAASGLGYGDGKLVELPLDKILNRMER